MITPGHFGHPSKIREQTDKFLAALDRSELAALVELAGLYHAMRGYLAVHHPSISLDDLRDHTTVPSSSREAK